MVFYNVLKMEIKPKRYNDLCVLLLAAAIIFRLILVSIHTISGDACWHYSVSKFIADNKNIPFQENVGREKNEAFWAPPLFHIIGAIFYSAFGEFGLKLVPMMFGSLSIFSRICY